MKKNNSKPNQTPVMISIMPLLAMLVSIIPSIVKNQANLDTVKVSVIVLLLTGVASIYIRVNPADILSKRLAKTIIMFSYLGSLLSLLVIPAPEIMSFWMLGGLLVAMLIDNKLGLLLHCNLSFLMGVMITKRPEDVIRVLIIGFLMCMLAGSLKRIGTVVYSAIIILSSNITLAFTIHNFSFEDNLNHDYLKSLFSVFVVLMAGFLIAVIYQNIEKKVTAKYSEAVGALLEAYSEDKTPDTLIQPEKKLDIIYSEADAKDTQTIAMEIDETAKHTEVFTKHTEVIAKDTDAIDNGSKLVTCEIGTDTKDWIKSEGQDIQISLGTRTSYEVLCDLENDLIMKMKAHSQALYEHAVYIGDLSYRAAIEINANAMLAMAGGLYHEVGKIKGKNYIEEGLIIAEDYAFPKELKAILKEHNIKYEKPSSVEAAIVMLSDSVVSTIEYIEKTEEHKYTTNKVIDNIFQLRMDKGTFDAANISLKEYKKLKDFYQKEFLK